MKEIMQVTCKRKIMYYQRQTIDRQWLESSQNAEEILPK